MEWLGLVGALAGSTITGLLALWLDSLRGKRDALEAKNQREHERIERRYQDRLDAYAAFEETAAPDGTPSVETGRKYRREILEAGGSRPAMESFKAFRGREPSLDALLRHQGMA